MIRISQCCFFFKYVDIRYFYDIKQFKKSVELSTVNVKNKSCSYIKLLNIYFMKIKNFFFGINILVLVAISAFLGSCQWVTIELPPAVSIPVDKVVSFATDIEPIYTTDGCISCHSGSGAPKGLDLTTGKAYSSIIAAGSVNTTTPESSLIYTVPAISGTHYKKYTQEQSAYLLKWIKDGAKNN